MARRQITLAGTGFEKYTKTTRRAQFLAEMDAASERKRCEMVKVRIAQLGRRTA